jgi:hypothetical protein
VAESKPPERSPKGMKNYSRKPTNSKTELYETLQEMIDATNKLLHYRPLFEIDDCPPWEYDNRLIKLGEITQIQLRLTLIAAREALRAAQDEIPP